MLRKDIIKKIYAIGENFCHTKLIDWGGKEGYNYAKETKYLIKLIEDGEEGCICAAEVLGMMRDELGNHLIQVTESVEHLIKILMNKSKDSKDSRWAAAYALGKIGDSRAVDPLIKLLLDKDEEYLRTHAAMALGKINDSKAIDSLVQTLNDEYEYIGPAAAEALCKIIDSRVIEPLIQYIEKEDIVGSYKLEAVTSVIENLSYHVDNPKVVKCLLNLLMHENSCIRSSAAESIGFIFDYSKVPKLIEPLIQLLDDPSNGVRYCAIGSLGKIGGTKAISALLSIGVEGKYTDEILSALVDCVFSWGARTEEDAIEYLSLIDDPNVKRFLQFLLKNKKYKIRDSAKKSIGYIEFFSNNPKLAARLYHALHILDYENLLHSNIIDNLRQGCDTDTIEMFLDELENNIDDYPDYFPVGFDSTVFLRLPP